MRTEGERQNGKISPSRFFSLVLYRRVKYKTVFNQAETRVRNELVFHQKIKSDIRFLNISFLTHYREQLLYSHIKIVVEARKTTNVSTFANCNVFMFVKMAPRNAAATGRNAIT